MPVLSSSAASIAAAALADDPAIAGVDEFGGDDVDDVLALLAIIDRLPGVDENRIGMLGWSRGGMMSLLAATRTTRLKALVVGGTPTDLAAELALRPEMERVFRARIPGYDTNRTAALQARSAVHFAASMDPALPILILHGARDNRVSVDSARKLANVLSRLQRPHRLIVYDEGSHGLLEHNPTVVADIIAWFRAKLDTPLPAHQVAKKNGGRAAAVSSIPKD